MSKKLLLADDSITIQKVIQITFAHEDYELTITDNGDAALVKAQELKPDLVMTDIYMPGKNGYELTSAIKNDPNLKHVPVLLLAGSFEPFDEDKARSCKADAWIEKPFESQNLIDKVAELLSAAQAVPEIAVPAVESPVAAAEEVPFAAFDENVSVEQETSPISDDPFGDISFEEEAPVSQPEPVATAVDDWSDVAAEAVAEEPLTEEASATTGGPVEEIGEDFSFAEEAPIESVSDDFSFVEEDLMLDAETPVVEETPTVADVFDTFDMGDEEIMPLDDDDILGAEDLEPALPEQTLAAWSRDESSDDVFAEVLEEGPTVEDEDVFAMDEPVAAEPEPFAAEPEPFAAEPEPFAAEPEPFAAEPEPFATEPEPAAVEPERVAVAATLADVEAKSLRFKRGRS